LAKSQLVQKKGREHKGTYAVVQDLVPEICESVRTIMAELMAKTDLAPETADRLHVASTYWFLHMIERLLHLIEPEEKASLIWKEIAKGVSKEVYGTVTGYFKAPDSHYEYFNTFFMNNYQECSSYLKEFTLPVEPSGETFKAFLDGFGKWLSESIEEDDVLPCLLDGLAQKWCDSSKFLSFCSAYSDKTNSK